MIKGYQGRHRARWAPRQGLIRASVTVLVALLLSYWGTGAASVPGPLGTSQGVSSPIPPPCLSEAGNAAGPCAWHCATMGNRRCGPDTPPVIIIHQER